jgi:hypothetical protein
MNELNPNDPVLKDAVPGSKTDKTNPDDPALKDALPESELEDVVGGYPPPPDQEPRKHRKFYC